VNAFIEDYSKVNKKSWRRDIASCKALGAYFNGKKLTQITAWHVDKYKYQRLKSVSYRKSQIKQATVNRELACLKTMLKFAVGKGWISKNHLTGYKLFKERPNKVRVVTRRIPKGI
jgi:site-specific recombinase XerD